MIDFYGAPASSAGRTHVMLEECGLEYKYHRVNLRDPGEKAAFVKVNPAGRVPFIIDGDVRLQESIAINFYLAENYAPQLWANNLADRATIYAWSLWAITNLQEEAIRVLHHSFVLPEEKRSPYEVETGKLNTQNLIDELERAMPESGFLVGDRLTVADINVGSVTNLAAATRACTLGPKVQAHLTMLKERPAWQAVAKQG